MNRSIKITIILLTVLLLGGCGIVSNKQSDIFDNEDRLMESADSYTFTSKTGEINSEQGVVKFSGFSGIYTVWQLTNKSDTTTTITISGKIKHGKFKVIQIIDDHQLSTLWNSGENKDISITIPKGNSAIKWVGRNATGDITVKLESQEGLEVLPQSDLFQGDLFDDTE